MASKHFEPGETVETTHNAETMVGEIFVHRGTLVAVELDDGSRDMFHQNKVEKA